VAGQPAAAAVPGPPWPCSSESPGSPALSTAEVQSQLDSLQKTKAWLDKRGCHAQAAAMQPEIDSLKEQVASASPIAARIAAQERVVRLAKERVDRNVKCVETAKASLAKAELRMQEALEQMSALNAELTSQTERSLPPESDPVKAGMLSAVVEQMGTMLQGIVLQAAQNRGALQLQPEVLSSISDMLERSARVASCTATPRGTPETSVVEFVDNEPLEGSPHKFKLVTNKKLLKTAAKDSKVASKFAGKKNGEVPSCVPLQRLCRRTPVQSGEVRAMSDSEI